MVSKGYVTSHRGLVPRSAVAVIGENQSQRPVSDNSWHGHSNVQTPKMNRYTAMMVLCLLYRLVPIHLLVSSSF